MSYTVEGKRSPQELDSSEPTTRSVECISEATGQHTVAMKGLEPRSFRSYLKVTLEWDEDTAEEEKEENELQQPPRKRRRQEVRFIPSTTNLPPLEVTLQGDARTVTVANGQLEVRGHVTHGVKSFSGTMKVDGDITGTVNVKSGKVTARSIGTMNTSKMVFNRF
jgi:hypothetical protein